MLLQLNCVFPSVLMLLIESPRRQLMSTPRGFVPVSFIEESGTAESGGETEDNMGGKSLFLCRLCPPSSIVAVFILLFTTIHQPPKVHNDSRRRLGNSHEQPPAPKPSSSSRLTPNELALIDLCTDRGGLKLRSRPNARMTLLRILALEDEKRSLDDSAAASKRRTE